MTFSVTVNKVKLEKQIAESLCDVRNVGWLEVSALIGSVKGVQVHLVVTRDKDNLIELDRKDRADNKSVTIKRLVE